MSPLSKLLRAAVMLALAFGPRVAGAQKALVYCPVSIDATGCATIKTALTSAYPGGIDTGFDGTQGTVDLKTVDLFQYSVVVVPSLADDSTAPYALLRDATVASKLKAALLGRRAFWSGTPDQGVVSTTRPQKDALIQNLAAWAGGDFATVNAPGLVVLQDNSTDLTKRYDWVQAIAGFALVADTRLASYSAVSSLTAAGNAVLSSNGSTLAYSNMASMGFQTPSGAPGTSMDAVGKTGTGVGGQVVLITQSGANTGGAVVTTDKDDYAPGTPVVITGTGFAAGESVTLLLHEDPTIEPDFSFTVTADQNGGFVFSGFTPDTLDVEVRFILRATGQISGRVAQTTFTDGPTDYGISISPTSASSGGTLSVTIRIWNASTSNNNLLGSARIAIPTGWTVGTLQTPIVAGQHPAFTWTAAQVSGVIQLQATANSSRLDRTTGSNVADTVKLTFNATAPSVSSNTDYTWAAQVRTAIDFTGSDWTLVGSAATITVAPAAAVSTSTTLTSSANPSTFGAPVTFTATVARTSGSGTAPTGQVQFKIDGTNFGSPVTLLSGAATSAPTSSLSAGSHAITADYAPDAPFSGSSGTLTQNVGKTGQTIAGFSLSALNKVFGDASFSIATGVTGGGSGNPVTFASLTTATCTITAAGQVTIVAAGQCTATADQAGNASYNPAPQVTQSFTIGQASSSVGITWANSTYNGTANAATAVAKNGGGGTIAGATVALVYYSGSTATGTALAGAPTAAGTYTVQASYAGSAGTYAASSSSATITIAKATASVTPNALSKIYGAVDPTLTGTLTGFIAGDAITAAYTRAAGETVAGGPYTISATLSPAAALNNYDITYNTAAFTITKATASVTPAAASKTYGAADPSLTGALSGFASADNVTATYSRTAGETVAGSPYTISATLAPASVLANYNITYNTGNFTIDKATASVTPAAATKSYGTADPAFTGTLTGFVASDNVTATYARTAGETVAGGPYTISATLAPAGVLGNYTITYNTAAFTITKAIASVTPNAASKTYGTADPALTGTTSGFVAADGITATYSRVAGETVAGGPYDISATLSPAAALANYQITYNTAAFTIDKATASVSPAAASKTYGTADPILGGTLSGFLAADAVVATYTRVAGETVAGGPYTISATLAPAGVLGNYDITYNTANFTIDKANASVTPAAASKTYGTADPPLSGALSGFLAADGVTATYARTSGETVAGSPYTISATLSPAGVLGNYNITYNTATFTINKALASVTPAAASKVYGDADPTLSGSLSGFLAADNVTASYARVAGETVAGSPYKISATLAPAGVLGNYDITYNTADFTIDKKPASVSPNVASKTYGDADPALTGSLVGFLAADNVTATYSRAAGETVAGGPYSISATLSPAGVLGNYDIAYNTAQFTITPRAAAVSPAVASKIYGDADPTLSGSLSGFLAADNVSANYSRTAGETVAGSPYTISATLAPAGVLTNYDITYNTASFTITKKAASVTPAVASKTYGTPDPALGGTLTGFLAADAVVAVYTRAPGETVAGSPYAISATLSPVGVLGNYDITYNTAAFTIDKAIASVTPIAASKTYGAADPAFTGSTSGFLPADNVTASYSRATGETVAGGPYTISATLSPAGVLSNYDITYNTANFTINKAPLTITAADKSRLYGDANPALTGTIVGLQFGDEITADYTTTAVPQSPVGPYAIVPAAIDCTPSKLGNYDVTLTNGTLTVTKAPLTIVAASLSRIYGDPNPTLTGAITGIKNGDGITANYSTTATTASVVGPYAIVASAVDATPAKLGNYDLTLSNGILTVTQRTLTITANSLNKTFGQTLTFVGSEFTTGSGQLVNGDIVSSVTLTSAGAAPAATVPGSPYAIIPTNAVGAKLTNYSIGYVNGSLTVNKAVIAAPILSNLVQAYTGAPLRPTVTISPAGVQVTLSFADDGVTVGSNAGVTPVGVYNVLATITDQNYTGPTADALFVIYDASAGFVTGGGWIMSGPNSYMPDPSLTGKANFGFVSKYQKGANVPTGNTEFQFKEGNLNFSSTNFQWLVIQGTTSSQFKGTGTINGKGSYNFMVTAVDGDNYGNKKPDSFRMKITDAVTGALVYDNKNGFSDTSGAATDLGGGSIVIHDK